MSAPHSVQSIPDTALGLTQGELQFLRHHQQLMAQRSHQSTGGADRGRTPSRHSQPSSRVASAASSQNVHHRVVLDPRYLAALSTHLDNVMRAIETRLNELEDTMQSSVNASSNRHAQTASSAEAAVERVRRLLKDIEAFEDDLKRVKHIKEVVRRLRARTDDTADRLDRSTPSHHGESRHGSHHHGSDRYRR